MESLHISHQLLAGRECSHAVTLRQGLGGLTVLCKPCILKCPVVNGF